MSSAKVGLSFCACLLVSPGCATWLPAGSEPAAASAARSFGVTTPSPDSAGIETILVRIEGAQAKRLTELWQQIDEQVLTPELRFAMDKNGIRAGKIACGMPSLLEQWILQTEARVGEDPMEQAGFAADVSSFSQLWRCRTNVRKELSVRKSGAGPISLFYNDTAPKGHVFDEAHFIYAMQAAPMGDTSATIRLVPEVQHGELVKRVDTAAAGIRLGTRRESVTWDQLAIDLRIQRGDCIVIGPTPESRGLGEHFFHTKTQSGEIQPVLLLVRLSESAKDDAFEHPKSDVATTALR